VDGETSQTARAMPWMARSRPSASAAVRFWAFDLKFWKHQRRGRARVGGTHERDHRPAIGGTQQRGNGGRGGRAHQRGNGARGGRAHQRADATVVGGTHEWDRCTSLIGLVKDEPGRGDLRDLGVWVWSPGIHCVPSVDGWPGSSRNGTNPGRREASPEGVCQVECHGGDPSPEGVTGPARLGVSAGARGGRQPTVTLIAHSGRSEDRWWR
jgi:hypothetical protein